MLTITKDPEDSLPGFIEKEEKTTESFQETRKNSHGKKGGGFQAMGLSFNLLKGVIKRGYKQPTPIQRKVIPVILEGKDVVAMARTGSGKTACFLIPLFEKLKQRMAKSGARALILSPTRELALQTLKFVKEIGRFTDLKSAVILGGDSMDDQFSVLHGNPDIIVATPGRFLHVCVEMDLKLSNIEYIVFDEADRLFEMGLGEQLSEIIARLPDSRQTLLFSATLPKVLVEFAKAGLSDPILIRLDVESKLPTGLELFHLNVRPEEKLAALLVLLKSCVKEKEQTLVFAATKYHVEYLHNVLTNMGVENTYIYSNLDPSARKIHAAKFSSGKVKIMIVTDVAARGIDIPQLDVVINFNFPGKSKLFVHRVGRCARAGRSGKAFSLITPDEYAHLLDLHLFLGRPFTICTLSDKDGAFGSIPQSLIEEQQSTLLNLHEVHSDLENLKKVSENGYQQYLRSRPTASSDSNRRVKELPFLDCYIHPVFRNAKNVYNFEREKVLHEMKFYRPHGTIFELTGKNKSEEYMTMKTKRVLHSKNINDHRLNKEKRLTELSLLKPNSNGNNLLESQQSEIDETFQKVILPKRKRIDDLYKKKVKVAKIDRDNYIPHVPVDDFSERGLAVNKFQNEAKNATFDLVADSEKGLHSDKQKKRWDRKKKKMVGVQSAKAGKIKTESGIWIAKTYKSDRYNQWKEKTKTASNEDGEDEDMPQHQNNSRGGVPGTHWAKHNAKIKQKQRKSEIKSVDEILKARKIAAKNKRLNMKKKKKGRRK